MNKNFWESPRSSPHLPASLSPTTSFEVVHDQRIGERVVRSLKTFAVGEVVA